MKLLTRSVTRESQLEVGAWYKIVGTTSSGFELPPQAFLLEEKYLPLTTVGDRWVKGYMVWGSAGKMFHVEDHKIQLHEVNVPEHGLHDIHLERVDDEIVRSLGWKVKRYSEIEQDKWR
jgi:hypothetical protein|tara:strand:+ start:152 stop:508 length:357 start_codon:yes stop_codon:yes gene_type:complete